MKQLKEEIIQNSYSQITDKQCIMSYCVKFNEVITFSFYLRLNNNKHPLLKFWWNRFFERNGRLLTIKKNGTAKKGIF